MSWQRIGDMRRHVGQAAQQRYGAAVESAERGSTERTQEPTASARWHPTRRRCRSRLAAVHVWPIAMRASFGTVLRTLRGNKPEGESPGWRAEMRSRSAAGRAEKRSGGWSVTASPSIPAGTAVAAVISRFVAVHARGSGWPGRPTTTIPSRPPSRVGRVPPASTRSWAYGLFETSTITASLRDRPRSSVRRSGGAGACGPMTSGSTRSRVRSLAAR